MFYYLYRKQIKYCCVFVYKKSNHYLKFYYIGINKKENKRIGNNKEDYSLNMFD